MVNTLSALTLCKRGSHLLLALIIGTTLALAAAAQPGSQDQHSAYGENFSAPRLAPRQQARIYAWRPADATYEHPVNLYIDGRYHASLLRGGYTEFCTAPVGWSLQSVPNDAGKLHTGKQQTGLALNPQAGQVLFLRIQDFPGKNNAVQILTQEQALNELGRTRLQLQTISRAPKAQECSEETVSPATALPPVTAAAPKPTQPREYALKTDALFEFGKTELRASGFNAIEQLIHQVNQDYLHIDRIRVLGYTDAIGPEKLNRKLSLARAQSVAERLHNRGLKSKTGIEVEGRGADALVKTDCRNAPTPANKACHAPNRRVVIVVYGPRR